MVPALRLANTTPKVLIGRKVQTFNLFFIWPKDKLTNQCLWKVMHREFISPLPKHNYKLASD
jgi:hypothetical protein